ncbi:MAG: response regulator transcription factor [Coriobacteriales bacterium]|jgi:two-component system response regulator VanR|nr:response regulator transcription factor [Coriobacteriales bacterium]
MNDMVLVVDDEPEIASLVALYLQNEGAVVSVAHTANEALASIASDQPDIALLDIMLPDMDGFALCQRIREQHSFPIIMITAKDADLDKITGLTLGADDYITKPFKPLELVARVKAHLRRYKRYNDAAKPNEEAEGVFVYKGLMLDVARHECSLDGEALALTPTEFTILTVLCQNRGKVVSSEQLYSELWGDEYYNKATNSITVHIRHLREKLHDSAEKPAYIKTVWGVGYKLDH